MLLVTTTINRLEDLGGLSHITMGAGGLTQQELWLLVSTTFLAIDEAALVILTQCHFSQRQN